MVSVQSELIAAMVLEPGGGYTLLCQALTQGKYMLENRMTSQHL